MAFGGLIVEGCDPMFSLSLDASLRTGSCCGDVLTYMTRDEKDRLVPAPIVASGDTFEVDAIEMWGFPMDISVEQVGIKSLSPSRLSLHLYISLYSWNLSHNFNTLYMHILLTLDAYTHHDNRRCNGGKSKLRVGKPRFERSLPGMLSWVWCQQVPRTHLNI